MAVERRLLVVTESLGVGGTETHLIRLLVPLAARGWSITVYCLTERGQRADQVEAAGIRVLSSPRRANRGALGIRNLANIALAANRLFWLMRRWRPHIAHFYLPGPYLVGAPLAIAARTPTKVMSRRSLSRYQEHWPMVARLERLLHRRMDMVIGNSRAVVRDLSSEGIPSSKIQLIYNGIDTTVALPKRSTARRALGIEKETLVGVVVANLISYKGHKDLIEGLASVAQSLPSGWRVLCAGRDEGLQPRLESLVKASGIEANIQFLGERADVPRLLAAADFGVLSSWEEGFSNVILEAMSAGLPMIVTRVGGNPEAVINQETGLVVPPRDAAALGEAVLSLAQDPDLRRRLGAAARLRVRQEFSIERCVEAHKDLYEGLLTERLGAIAAFPLAEHKQRRRPIARRDLRPGVGALGQDGIAVRPRAFEHLRRTPHAGERAGAQLHGIDQAPRVSVVVPAYNRGELLSAAVASVLTQSFDDLELLVVDDGSNEDLDAALAATVKDPRVRMIRHTENRGTAAARNTGTSSAKGDYIAFLDSDDVWYPEKLARQLAWMESHGELVSCTGYRVATGLRPGGELRLSLEVGFRDLLWGCVVSPGSTMIAKKALLDEVGPFDESLRRLEDWEWLLRCAQLAPIGMVPEILAIVHPSAREAYPWEDVRDSASTIESYALAGKYPLRARDRRILRATLHSEVAAAAFRRWHYGSSTISFLKSIYYHPLKRASYYRRIVSAVKGDVLRSISRDRLTPSSAPEIDGRGP